MLASGGDISRLSDFSVFLISIINNEYLYNEKQRIRIILKEVIAQSCGFRQWCLELTKATEGRCADSHSTSGSTEHRDHLHLSLVQLHRKHRHHCSLL